MNKNISQLVGLVVLVLNPTTTLERRREERGLSQSTENAVLLAGAVTIAAVVITVVGNYVKTHLPK